MNLHQIVILIVSCISLNQASKLPSFITPCKGTDPNLRECVIKEANNIIPHIIKGYRPLRIPVLSPLQIDELKIQNNGPLDLVLKNAKMNGFEECRLTDFNIDFISQLIDIKAFFPRLHIQGDYNISGQLLFLPLTGQGPFNFTLVDSQFDVNVSYMLYDKGGVQHAKLNIDDVKIDLKRAHVYLANILNNKAVSDDVNALLNKEWRQAFTEFEPAFKQAMAVITLQIVDGLVEEVPYADLFDNSLP